MLTIDRLRLHLPAPFCDRARDISRLVAEELAVLPLEGELRRDHLVLPPVQLNPSSTDLEVARAVARSIHVGILNQE
jgi:hypothetical protein